jgi:hypothetical protein
MGGRGLKQNVLALVFLSFGCGGESHTSSGKQGRGGESGTSGSGGDSSGTGGSSGSSGSSGKSGEGGEGGEGAPCVETPLVERRLVRLTTHQIVQSVAALVGTETTNTFVETEGIPPVTSRSFPPLADTGNVYGDGAIAQVDRLGDLVGRTVRDAFTECGDAPTDDCARGFVADFAERAFRRPVATAERDNLVTVYDECKALGATIPEAVQYAVWAVVHSPLFLYRSELGEGDPARDEVPLAPHEMASELSYFLTDGPPDAELLEAARRGELSTPEELGAHAERLLASAPARANFETAMMAYFGISAVPAVVIDPASVPGLAVTTGLLNSIHHEGELFFRNMLWDGAVTGLLTTRRAWVNNQVAMPIYGVPTAAPDPNVFEPVELPENRAGVLTSSPFLTAGSRPDRTSPVARGLRINAAILCQENPPFFDDEPLSGVGSTAALSEREKAEYRAAHALCAGCHAQFDAFGLALESFDSIGRFRTVDLEGRPIDTRVTLPDILEGRVVSGAAELARVIAESGHFEPCLAMNLMNFAFADISQGGARAPSPQPPAASCAVEDVVRAARASGEVSFSALVTEIARSRALRFRRVTP